MPHQLAYWLLCFVPISAVATDLDALAQRQFKQNAQQIQKREQAQNQPMQVPVAKSVHNTAMPTGELPCFVIESFNVLVPAADEKTFAPIVRQFTQQNSAYLMQCLGIQTVQFLQSQLHNVLIQNGFITAQVSIAAQDLSSGVLELTVIPGKTNAIIFAPDSQKTALLNTMAARPHSLLNLHDMETSLENLRLPSSAKVQMDIVAAKRTAEDYGYSDLLIHYQKARAIQVALEIADSGSADTGLYQANLNLIGDAPLGLSDVLTVNYGRSLDALNKTGLGAGNDSVYLHYVLPWRNWRLHAQYDQYHFYEILRGLHRNLKYQGRAQHGKWTLSRIIYRQADARWSAYITGYYRRAQKYIDDLELLIQRRTTAGWQAGLRYQQHLPQGFVAADIRYHKGTNAFGAENSPESQINLAQAKPQLLTLNVQYQRPVSWRAAALVYQLNWQSQLAEKSQVAQDAFAIGGRYSLRGVADVVGAGDNGMLWQNELSWQLRGALPQLFVTLDAGWVMDKLDTGRRSSHALASSVGLRFRYRHLALDIFAGQALKASAGIKKTRHAGFDLLLR